MANSIPQKVTVSEITGHDVFHYSIPNVQEFNSGAVEEGSTIQSDKILISSPCVLISKLNPRKGTVVLAEPDAELQTVASTEFVPLEGKSQVDNRFIYWVAQSSAVTAYLSGLVMSTTNSHQRVQPSDVLGMRIPWPDAGMRSRIAEYLDREAAEIDAMDAELDRLTETLRERRTTLVAEAVHLFTDPTQLPTGWSRLPLKFAVGSRFSGEWGGEPGTGEVNVRCVRVADFDRHTRSVGVEIPTVRSIPNAKAQLKALQPGDLLLERSGGTEKKPVGVMVLYVGPKGAISSNFIECVRLTSDHDPNFWRYVQEAAYGTRFTQVHVRQTSGIQNLDAQGFYDEYFSVPDLETQRSIAAHLDGHTARIDDMIADAHRLKALLAERRTTLITEVVTGKREVPA